MPVHNTLLLAALCLRAIQAKMLAAVTATCSGCVLVHWQARTHSPRALQHGAI